MGDFNKFQNDFLYYSFNVSLICIIASEVFIFLFTDQKGKGKTKRQQTDKGTRWLLCVNFITCLYISVWFVSQNCPLIIRDKLLPYFFSYVGIVLMLLEIAIRLTAVLTLKKAFTLNVQTTDEQRLVTTGIYRKVRNPAYTGSIMSLVGTALSLRNWFATVLVLAVSIICYSIRIHVEEATLRERFQDEFREYETNTYRLIPYIW